MKKSFEGTYKYLDFSMTIIYLHLYPFPSDRGQAKVPT